MLAKFLFELAAISPAPQGPQHAAAAPS
jgi:hypothetical protein